MFCEYGSGTDHPVNGQGAPTEKESNAEAGTVIICRVRYMAMVCVGIMPGVILSSVLVG